MFSVQQMCSSLQQAVKSAVQICLAYDDNTYDLCTRISRYICVTVLGFTCILISAELCQLVQEYIAFRFPQQQSCGKISPLTLIIKWMPFDQSMYVVSGTTALRHFSK